MGTIWLRRAVAIESSTTCPFPICGHKRSVGIITGVLNNVNESDVVTSENPAEMDGSAVYHGEDRQLALA